MNWVNVIAVGFGGCLGSIARYVSVTTIDAKLNGSFPSGTLIVNVVGSFLLGLLIGGNWRMSTHTTTRLFFTTGFCGGFTTFSAFAFENVNLVQQRMPGVSVMYIIITLAAGFLALAAGLALGRALS